MPTHTRCRPAARDRAALLRMTAECELRQQADRVPREGRLSPTMKRDEAIHHARIVVTRDTEARVAGAQFDCEPADWNATTGAIASAKPSARPDVVVTALSLSHTPFCSPHYPVSPCRSISAPRTSLRTSSTRSGDSPLKVAVMCLPGERRISELDFNAIPSSHRGLHLIDWRFPEYQAAAEPREIVMVDDTTSGDNLAAGFHETVVSRLRITPSGGRVHGPIETDPSATLTDTPSGASLLTANFVPIRRLSRCRPER